MGTISIVKNIGSFVLAGFIILIFCIFALVTKESARNFLGVLFLVIGFIFTFYKHKVGRFFYDKQIGFIKQRSSVEKLAMQARQMGTRLLITGALFLIITIFLRMAR